MLEEPDLGHYRPLVARPGDGSGPAPPAAPQRTKGPVARLDRALTLAGSGHPCGGCLRRVPAGAGLAGQDCRRHHLEARMAGSEHFRIFTVTPTPHPAARSANEAEDRRVTHSWPPSGAVLLPPPPAGSLCPSRSSVTFCHRQRPSLLSPPLCAPLPPCTLLPPCPAPAGLLADLGLHQDLACSCPWMRGAGCR